MRLWILLFLILTNLAHAENATYYVFNQTDKKVVHSYNASLKRPIASVSKLMTALVVVESSPNWDEKIKYKGHIFFNKQLSKRELFESLLIRSDNKAADAFADAWPGGYNAFIKVMNETASRLGMTETYFDDPSGLSRNNVSTAEDLNRLIAEASKYDIIRHTSSSKYLKIEEKIGKKVKSVLLNNTNKGLLFEFDQIILSKTGFTNPAGRCLALLTEKNGKRYAIVILGEKTPREREERARQLINNYVTIQQVEKDFE